MNRRFWIVVAAAWAALGGCEKGQSPRRHEPGTAQNALAPTAAVTPASDTAPGAPPCRPAPATSDDAWVTATNLYQIFPATFTAEGTLAAMVDKVDYLEKLGVETVWLMPVFRAMSTHGYDTIDYRQIEPRYGSTADLKAFVDRAHCRGIRVLLDLVINHTGSQNPWFSGTDAERKDHWFVWKDKDLEWADPWENGVGRPNATWFEDPLEELDRDGNGKTGDDDFFHCVFCDGAGKDMPDFDWKSALATLEAGKPSDLFDEVEGIMRFWIEEAQVDGYRADAVRYMVENGPPPDSRDQPETHRVWRELRRRLTAISPSAALVAEAPTETYDEMIAYYGSPTQPEFQGAFHFKYQGVLVGAAKEGTRHGNFFADLHAIQSRLPFDTAKQRLLGQDFVFLSNHDSFAGARVATQLDGNVAKTKLAGSLYLLLSGNPVIYYGEELGMQNAPGQSGDAALRGPLDWSAATAQQGQAGSFFNHYAGLLRIRRHYPALRGGISFAVPSKNGSGGGFDSPGASSSRVVFLREFFGEKVLVMNNLSDQVQHIHVNLAQPGLPPMPDKAVMTVLMGGGSSDLLTTANRDGYFAGTLQPFTTRVLYLGPLRGEALPAPLYEAVTSSWTAAAFRGTPNDWGTTPMTKNERGVWQVQVTFDGTDPRFKVDRNGDWSESYPPADHPITQGAGEYLISFDDASKAIAVDKL
jgi:alpha-amylase